MPTHACTGLPTPPIIIPCKFSRFFAMIGRLFRLALLFVTAFLLIRWLFSREQRQTVREFIHTLAIALLASSLLFLLLNLAGVRL